MRLRGVLILCVTAALPHPVAFAGWRDVLPRPVENGAFLDLFASFESDENRHDGQSVTWNDTFLRQKVTLFSNGYIYHPRFLQYQVSFAGALKEERYRASFLDRTGWTRSSGAEYDGTVTILPEHPYNLELFARRFEPLFKEQSATQRRSVETSRGMRFQYRMKPWFFDARYSSDSIESGMSSSDVRRVNASGEYLKRYRSGNQFSVSSAYNHSDFTSDAGFAGTSVQGQLAGVVDLPRLKLSSSVMRNTFDQEGDASGRFESDQFAFHEILTVYLPLNFRSDLSYRLQDNNSIFPGGGAGASRSLTDYTEEYQLDVVHRLYQSLDTTYRYLKSDRTASGGDTTAASHFLAFNYTKSVPRGRVQAGINLSRTETASGGRTDVVNEPHQATPVPGSFTLSQQNVERQSIAVFLRSPLAPFQAILLVENLHYAITPVANRFDINIILLPPQFAVPGTYDFFASYSLTTGDFRLGMDSRGYTGSVELFDHFLTPYYSYVAIRTDDLSGDFPGTALDSTTRTAGLMVFKGPVRGRLEYQTLEWEVSPYRAWKAELQAVGSLRSAGSLYLTASYLNKHFPQGTTAQMGEEYTEANTSASGGIRKQMGPRNLLLSAGGSLSRLQGLVDSLAYTLNASLSWKIGRLDLSLGASAYRSSTEGAVASSITRDDQYYYVRLRRQLF